MRRVELKEIDIAKDRVRGVGLSLRYEEGRYELLVFNKLTQRRKVLYYQGIDEVKQALNGLTMTGSVCLVDKVVV